MSKSIIDRKVVIIDGVEFPVSTDLNEVFEDLFVIGATAWEVPKIYTTGDLTKLATLGLLKHIGEE